MQLAALCQALLCGEKGRSVKGAEHQPNRNKTILLAMKLTAIILLIACLHVSANGVAQVSIRCTNASVKEVLNAIQKQTNYLLFYNEDILKGAKPVTLNVKNQPVDQVLKLAFKGQPLDYRIEDKTIFIIQKEASEKTTKNKFDVVEVVSQLLDTIDVKGRIVNEKNEPVVSATVIVKGTKNGTSTDVNGQFHLKAVPANATLIISAVNIETREYKVGGKSELANINVKIAVEESEAVVIYNTGYEFVPKERATGSFTHIDNELINRSVSTNVLERLQDVTNGLLFQGYRNTNVLDNIQIRGESTISASKRPLVVLDNFEYEGDINNINPNDVESITILKDAAAASIWGAKSGNGVIVITTKKGRYNTRTNVTLNSNVTIAGKPDLFYPPLINVADFVEIEKFLFEKGYYDNSINSTLNPALTPAVDILARLQAGQITQQEADAQIDALKNHDARNDYLKYLHRPAINQQHAININGGGDNNKYYVSVGFDKNLSDIKGDDFNRLTVNVNNTYSFLDSKLEVTTGINFTQIATNDNGLSQSEILFNSSPGVYPYARLTDSHGTPLAITQYRAAYIDTAGGGYLLNWQYRPLEEINLNDVSTRNISYLANIGLRYKFLQGLNIDVNYRYGRTVSEYKNLHKQESYYARNLINQFSTIDWTTGVVTRPVPLGSILDQRSTISRSNDLRVQLNFHKTWNDHSLNIIAGGAVSDNTASSSSNTYYGYNDENAIRLDVDNVSTFRHYITNRSIRISSGESVDGSTDRFVYYYVNASYNMKNRYTVTGSARKDASNLFGVTTNQKWIPLWSIGGIWDISKEPFYKSKWLQSLRLKSSYGYNGNLDKSVTAFLVVAFGGSNSYNLPSALLRTPPNPELRWERVGNFKVGADLSALNNRISGEFEYFWKHGFDLMAAAPLAPSTGLSTFRGNTASLKTRGFDFAISAKVLNGRLFKWNTEFYLNFTKDRIVQYDILPSNNRDYVIGINKVIGHSQSALFSYKWAGLDPTTGDPVGYLDKNKSREYTAIRNSTNLEDLTYHGRTIPSYFGALRNTFTWHQFSFSFNISYRLRYYFRRPSVNTNYASLDADLPHKDYYNRWQKPGDEEFTTVPAIVYPTNTNRQDFYNYSEVLVEKGDHIRFNDISVSYLLDRKFYRKLPFQALKVYTYISNFGIIWKANDKDIDPFYDIPPAKSIAAGIQIHF